jgi:anti-anti-sigma factor
MQSITIDVSHNLLHPDVATLRINGFIYSNTLVQIDKTLQTVMTDRKKNLIFDLTETNYISSGGWGLLITAYQRFRDVGGDLVLAGMKPEVHDAFELLEYNKVIRLFSNVETALKQAFTRPSANPVS